MKSGRNLCFAGKIAISEGISTPDREKHFTCYCLACSLLKGRIWISGGLRKESRMIFGVLREEGDTSICRGKVQDARTPKTPT
jgi:hypothetical protein